MSAFEPATELLHQFRHFMMDIVPNPVIACWRNLTAPSSAEFSLCRAVGRMCGRHQQTRLGVGRQPCRLDDGFMTII